MSYDKVDVPDDDGEAITLADEETGELNVPENPIIPIIHGDGIGTDVGPAAQKVLDAAAEATGRSIAWMRVYAGGSARDMYDENLPEDTVSAIRDHRVAIKGPLTTPVGAGFRSLNVALRKTLDLYANVRPTYYLDGVPSPVKNPEKMDMITFRENTEDVYAGIEWEAGTDEVEQVRDFLEDDMEIADVIHDGPVGIGVKPISEFGSKRLIREAIDYALANDRDSVTLVHKGNIMKFTEGAFRDWGYEVAEEEYGDDVITEDQLWEAHDGEQPEGTLVVKDRIADNMLQQLLTRTDEYSVIATMNLNGDYMSDAAGAQIGGLGIAPGINRGHGRCLAEPVHGSTQVRGPGQGEPHRDDPLRPRDARLPRLVRRRRPRARRGRRDHLVRSGHLRPPPADRGGEARDERVRRRRRRQDRRAGVSERSCARKSQISGNIE